MGSFLLWALIRYCKALTQHGTRISLPMLADVASIVEATQIFKQGRLSEVRFF